MIYAADSRNKHQLTVENNGLSFIKKIAKKIACQNIVGIQ
jgi:hypothetical protein